MAAQSLRGCEFTLSVHLLRRKGFWAANKLILKANAFTHSLHIFDDSPTHAAPFCVARGPGEALQIVDSSPPATKGSDSLPLLPTSPALPNSRQGEYHRLNHH